jgi:hypothetical protein
MVVFLPHYKKADRVDLLFFDTETNKKASSPEKDLLENLPGNSVEK